jgi:hypothetical protein
MTSRTNRSFYLLVFLLSSSSSSSLSLCTFCTERIIIWNVTQIIFTINSDVPSRYRFVNLWTNALILCVIIPWSPGIIRPLVLSHSVSIYFLLVFNYFTFTSRILVFPLPHFLSLLSILTVKSECTHTHTYKLCTLSVLHPSHPLFRFIL